MSHIAFVMIESLMLGREQSHFVLDYTSRGHGLPTFARSIVPEPCRRGISADPLWHRGLRHRSPFRRLTAAPEAGESLESAGWNIRPPFPLG
jgi:hypothetical protein